MSFDNPVARRIVAALSGGPGRLVDMLGDGEDAQDLVANGLTLCYAHVLWPAPPTPVTVGPLNAALLDASGGGDMSYRVLSCGTALPFSRGFLASLEAGTPLSPDAAPWADFLRRLG